MTSQASTVCTGTYPSSSISLETITTNNNTTVTSAGSVGPKVTDVAVNTQITTTTSTVISQPSLSTATSTAVINSLVSTTTSQQSSSSATSTAVTNPSVSIVMSQPSLSSTTSTSPINSLTSTVTSQPSSIVPSSTVLPGQHMGASSGTQVTMSTQSLMTSGIHTTPEETNFLRLTSLVLKIAPRAVRQLFDTYINPNNLNQRLISGEPKLKNLRGRVINQEQWKLLYPGHGNVSSTDFDLTLMVLLLRELSGVTAPSSGWNKLPPVNDQSHGADLARIKYYRNMIAHATTCSINNYIFHCAWQDLSQAIIRVGGKGFYPETNARLTSPLDRSYHELYRELRNLKDVPVIPLNIQFLHDTKLSIWSKEDETFIETRATKIIEEAVDQSTITLVTGPLGCGKSATIHHIALKLKDKGYRVCPVTSIKDVINFWMPDQEQVFVLDDPFGVHELNLPELDQWNRDKETLNICFEYSSMIIITSVRLHISEDEKFKMYSSPFDHQIVSLVDRTTILSDKERLDIFCKHVSSHKRDDLMVLAKDVQGFTISCFPLLCRIFVADKVSNPSVDEFFQRPLSVIDNELCHLQIIDPLSYFCLLYCMIYDNDINSDILDLENKCVENVNLRHGILEICKLSSSTPTEVIRSKLDTLLNTYLKREGKLYCFVHDIVHDAVIRHVNGLSRGSKRIFLKYCSSLFVKEKIRLKSIDCKDTDLSIILDDDDAWCGRIMNDIRDGCWNDVFNNPCLLSEKGTQLFANYLHTLDPQYVTKVVFNSSRNEKVVYRAKSKKTKVFEIVDDKLDDPKCKPVHWVVFAGLHRVLSEIIRLPNFSVEKQTMHLSLLILACMKGDLDIVKLLMNEGHYTANAITWFGRWKHILHMSPITDDLTPICVASSEGHVQVAAFLLENGADINAFTRKHGLTSLYVSSQNGHDNIVKLLIENGAKINKCNNDGESPLFVSSLLRHDKVVKILIENGAKINKCNKYCESPLYVSSCNGHDKVVKLLIENGANLNKCDKYGESPLCVSSCNGHDKVVKLLIENGVDINKCNIDGLSLLWISSFNGHDKVVKLLIESGADINKCNNAGRSPLYASSRNGRDKVVKLLIENKADINKCNNDGWSPLYVSSRNGHDKVVKMLIENGANVNKCDNDGWSPLYVSSRYGYDKVVKLLIENGADINKYDEKGVSPIYINI